jgi:NAD(P)-dependent dehydrogenase (short-subunit alcohol dehydrogenase family)
MTPDPTSPATALITGGTGSLGYETAKVIAGAGRALTVVITGRGAQATERAAAELEAATGGCVRGMALNLGSLDDVRRFAAELTTAQLPPLRSVVCNAGIQSVSGTTLTADGYEQTFGVNHLAHFLLVRELLPNLVEPARIVFVASGTHDPAKHTGMPSPVYMSAARLAVPDGPEGGTEAGSPNTVGRRRYTTSKLCNVLTTYELARRLRDERPGESITVNAFDPGLMPGTGLARDYGPVQAFAWKYVMPALTVVPGLNIHTPRRSAAALAGLVLDQDLAQTTGRYFEGKKEIRSSVDSYDQEKQRDLWDISVELTSS